MKKMSTYGKGSEDAVSPVIGVILMVAITVILAAVIAAFVFGMAGNVNKTRTVAVTAQKTNPSAGVYKITLTNMGGNDANSVSSFNWTIDGGTPVTNLTSVIGNISSSNGGTAAPNRVICVATFLDGTNQVVLDTTV